MLFKVFARTFCFATLAYDTRFRALLHHVDHHFINSLVQLTVSAVLNARDLLNSAYLPVTQGFVEGIHLSAVLLLTLDLHLLKFGG